MMGEKAIMLIVLLILGSLPVSLQQIEVVKAEPETVVVPDDYQMIRWAIGNATEGDTIFVKSGVYNETLLIEKSLSLIGEDQSTTIINGRNRGPVVYIRKDGVNVTGFTILNGDAPAPPSQFFPYGSRLAGIHLLSVSNCHITKNIVANSGRRIWLYDSHNINITENYVRDNQETGIRLESSSNNIIVGNSVRNGWGGIILTDSGNNTLRDNSVTDVTRGFTVSGSELSHFVNDVGTSNTIDDKPIRYLVNKKDLNINPSTFPDLDFLILVKCTNITVQNFQLTTSYTGIHLAYTTESTIMHNEITNSSIKLDYSSNNRIINNTAGISLESSNYNNIAKNSGGISLQRSSYNKITENNTTRRTFGISLTFFSCNNHVEGNDIAYNRDGIFFYESSNNNTIIGNNITQSGDSGIWVEGTSPNSNFNRIIGNNITENTRWGILLRSSYANTIVGNNIADNQYGIELSGDNCQKCHIIENTIANNEDGIRILTRYVSEFYHNNFIDNTRQIYCGSANISIQTWDNGYPFGGNYWSNYMGKDANNNGIGDSPYAIYENNKDRYPLMAPITIFDAGTWEWTSYNVDVISNSTVSDFSFDPQNTLVQFNVEGETGTIGFCRVTIPKDLLDAEDDWVVLAGDSSVLPSVDVGESNTYIYFTYGHSNKTVEIIGTDAVPEFPSWIILPLLIALIFAAIFYKKRLSKNYQRTKRSFILGA
jgi:parallel beta-helix repeat protein